MAATPGDVTALVPSWELHLRAERKSPQTLKSYLIGVRLYLQWCVDHGHPCVLDRHQVNAWVAGLLEAGAEAATARARQLSVRRFSAWCTDEGELDHDPLLTLKPPKLDVKVVPVLEVSDLERLIKACAGKDFRDRRDEAIARLMIETGMRAEECCSLALADLDLTGGTVTVRRGKGGKGRLVHVGPRTATAIDRYLRMRRAHRLADTDALWLGERGKAFGYYALWDTLKMRADRAGIEGFHPHRLRHTAASRWLEAGGSEGGAMAAFGWSRSDMLQRYVKSTSERRALAEAARLALGDL